jgi:hypothetical protein
MIISTDAKIYKTLFTFLFKTFNKLGIEEHIKVIYDNPAANIMLS